MTSLERKDFWLAFWAAFGLLAVSVSSTFCATDKLQAAQAVYETE